MIMGILEEYVRINHLNYRRVVFFYEKGKDPENQNYPI